MKIAGRCFRVRCLTVLFAFSAGAFLAVFLYDGFVPDHGLIPRWGMGLLQALAFLVLLLIAGRLIRFGARARSLLRRLVSGDYESGIRVTRFCKDEVNELEALFNRLVEQLRQYDDLRSTRIRQLRMTLDLVVKHTAEPMILLDVEKGVLNFNPAVSEIIGNDRQSVSLDTLRKLEANRVFGELLTRATAEEKTVQVGDIELQLPGQDTPKKVNARVIPYKEKAGNIPFAILFIRAVTADVADDDTDT
jgi:nitrogen fixation/metabolism regulation signal transduction histidine kinase